MAQDTKTTKYGFDIEDVLNSTGITYNRLVNKGLTIGRINVNKTVNPIDITNFGKNYIFFSKPDLNLFIDNKGTINPSIEANCPDLAQKIKRNLWVAQSLQASLTTEATRGPGSGLIHVLSDKCSSAEVPQITLSQKEAPKNSKGFGMSYGGNFFEDLVGKEITIEFIDNRDRDIQTLMEIWAEYIEGVSSGAIMKKKRYIAENKIDYAVNVFIFVIDEAYNIMSHIMMVGAYPRTINTQLLQYDALPPDAGKFIGPFAYQFHIAHMSKPNSHRAIEMFNYITGFSKEITFPNGEGSHNYVYKKINNYYIHTGMIPTGTAYKKDYPYHFTLLDKYPELVGCSINTNEAGVQLYSLVFASRHLGTPITPGKIYTREFTTDKDTGQPLGNMTYVQDIDEKGFVTGGYGTGNPLSNSQNFGATYTNTGYSTNGGDYQYGSQGTYGGADAAAKNVIGNVISVLSKIF